jgi:hypothetical protein
MSESPEDQPPKFTDYFDPPQTEIDAPKAGAGLPPALRSLRIGWVVALSTGIITGGWWFDSSSGLRAAPGQLFVFRAGVIAVFCLALFALWRGEKKRGLILMTGGILTIIGLDLAFNLVANVIGYFKAGS